MEFCCYAYPIRPNYDRSMIPRFCVKLEGKVIWDFPKDFAIKEINYALYSVGEALYTNRRILHTIKNCTQFGYFSYICIVKQVEMNIYNKSSLIQFWEQHADSKKELELWYNDISEQVWKTPNEVKNSYSDASIIKNNRAVFNICRNDYRLIVQFNYKKERAFIKFIGTHKDYDREDAATVNLFSPVKKPKNKEKKDKKK